MRTVWPASWAKFIELIYRIQDPLRSPFPGASTEPWFRGQSIAFPLDTTLHRRLRRIPAAIPLKREQVFWATAQTFYSKYRTLGASLLSTEDQYDPWRTLASMRHHNVPVQLLDWTTSFAAALFFALKSSASDGAEAVIYCLDPEGLNERYLGRRGLVVPGPSTTSVDVTGFHTHYLIGKRRRPRSTIALSPVMSHPRLIAQAGRFTISGWSEKPIEGAFSNSIALKIVLARAAEREAQQFLVSSGESEFTLFPDLDGLARMLITSSDMEMRRSIALFRRRRSSR